MKSFVMIIIIIFLLWVSLPSELSVIHATALGEKETSAL